MMDKFTLLANFFHIDATNNNVEMAIIPVESKPMKTPGQSGVNCTISRIERIKTMTPNTIEAPNRFHCGIGDFQ
jgi:hypothetical protein